MSQQRIFNAIEEENVRFRRFVDDRKRWRHEHVAYPKKPIGLFAPRFHVNESRDDVDAVRRRRRDPPERIFSDVAWKDVAREYIDSTSIHGLKYFGSGTPDVGVLGKLLWMVVMVCAFVCLALMVKVFFVRYEENPTRTYVKSETTPIFSVPFPAVTVCPSSPQSPKQQREVMKRLRIPGDMSREEAETLIKYSSEAVNPELSPPDIIDRERLGKILQFNGLRLEEFVKLITRPCADFVVACYWAELEIDCREHFKTTLTYRGFCCSFNAHLEEFARIGRKDKLNRFYPVGYGASSGLLLVLNKELFVGEDGKRGSVEKIMSNSIGVLIFVHPNLDYLGNEHPGYILQAGEEIHVRVQAKMTIRPSGFYRSSFYADRSLECLTSHDRKLNYFPEYRYSNCYASCRMRASLQLCGCVDYFYNVVSNKSELPICELKDFECLTSNSERLKIVSDVEWENFTCTCLDSCNSLEYFANPTWCTITENRFVPSSIYRNLSDDNAILRVFMSSQYFVTWETSPAADEFYLLSSIGGIYGLFLGCSFVSIVEIIYFCYLMCRTCTSNSRQN